MSTFINTGESWDIRARNAIHHGALTNSKRPESFVRGVYPTHIKSGKGCYLYSDDGTRYTDFICALGTNLLGYAHEGIVEAVYSQMHKGSLFSLSSTVEVEAAEKVKELFPFVSKVRFLKTGSDAASAAIRIARAQTGRWKVLSHGYHGHDDKFVSLMPPAVGVPDHAEMKTLVDIADIDDLTACVIVEPIITELSPQRIEYLVNLKAKCDKHGALLIFDEIITGFRFPKYSFSNYSGIQPDILLLGKCVGGGLPLSIVCTKKNIGDDLEWFISSTFAGDTLALAAFIKTTHILNNNLKLDDLWRDGAHFINCFNRIDPQLIKIQGYPTRGIFVAKDDLTKALFFQESCKAGLLFGPSWFFNFHHIAITEIVINSVQAIINRIKQGEVTLEGLMPQSPFAQKQREMK